MAYRANVISVMIASPGDVLEERNQVRDIIHEWNDLNSARTQSVLMPVGWETHSAPSLSGRPQEIINERVLDKCDLLVGVFWTRLGTPTGEAQSGTVEEIQRHLDAGKPVMVYFSTAPVAPQSLDQDQFNALQVFRKWCEGKGLIETYDNIADFRDKFRRQLQIEVRDNSYLASMETGTKPEEIERRIVIDADQSHPFLSEEAKTLLIEASNDKSGVIMSVRHMGGQAIQTNGRNFVDSSDRRSVARWEAAINELLEQGFITPRGNKGEIFEITDKGYKYSDDLVTRT
ncbi:hypothetical protein ACU5AY_00580 [Rhizobium sp. PAMB 3174]